MSSLFDALDPLRKHSVNQRRQYRTAQQYHNQNQPQPETMVDHFLQIRAGLLAQALDLRFKELTSVFNSRTVLPT